MREDWDARFNDCDCWRIFKADMKTLIAHLPIDTLTHMFVARLVPFTFKIAVITSLTFVISVDSSYAVPGACLALAAGPVAGAHSFTLPACEIHVTTRVPS